MPIRTIQIEKLRENILEWINPTIKYDSSINFRVSNSKTAIESPAITEEIVQEIYTGTSYTRPYIPISQRRTISRLVDYHRIAI